MRPAPKFKIGDEVIVIEGSTRPDSAWKHGGEGVITEVRWSDYWRGYGYHVQGYNDPGCKCQERWIRLKHRPAPLSFEQMMRDLKSKRPTIANLAEQLRRIKPL